MTYCPCNDFPSGKNILRSQQLASCGEQFSQASQCYFNCSNAMMSLPEFREATYVEGFAVDCDLQFEHAWIEVDGEIIDPTLPCNDLRYFSGIRVDGRQELAKALVDGPVPLFTRFGFAGHQCEEFAQARNESWKFYTAVAFG